MGNTEGWRRRLSGRGLQLELTAESQEHLLESGWPCSATGAPASAPGRWRHFISADAALGTPLSKDLALGG